MSQLKFENYNVVHHFRILIGEFIGTSLLLTMGCMGCVDTLGETFRANNNEALTFGIATMIGVRIFLHISGGHMNPAITLTSVLVQMTSYKQLPTYFVGQFSGAIFGTALFKFLTPENQLGEFLGTSLLLTMGCMGCVDTLGEKFRPNNNEALTFGISTMIAVRSFLHISGGHVNPAITITSVIVQMTSYKQLPTYFIGQFSGAIAGTALFKFITPNNQLGGGYRENDIGLKEKIRGTCSPYVDSETKYYEALCFEFFVTTILCWAWCSIWDYRNIHRMETSVFRYGITYNVLILCGTAVTKSHMNPARSFAPALLNGDWKHHWVFWAGPFGGAIFAALVYRFLLYESPEF